MKWLEYVPRYLRVVLCLMDNEHYFILCYIVIRTWLFLVASFVLIYYTSLCFLLTDRSGWRTDIWISVWACAWRRF